MSPLSYAVVPFTVNKVKRRLHVDLRPNDLAKPGEPFKIGYKSDRPSRIVVFAVDKGILQVTNFQTPDPLGYFFRKTALAVETSQIVDLIFPEFSILRAATSAGGDGEAEKRLNPFKRVTEKPVVFWSGVIDADSTEREVDLQRARLFRRHAHHHGGRVRVRLDGFGGKGCRPFGVRSSSRRACRRWLRQTISSKSA